MMNWKSAAVAAVSILAACTVHAAPVTLAFEGTIKGLFDPAGVLAGGFGVGQKFSGQLEFDPAKASSVYTHPVAHVINFLDLGPRMTLRSDGVEIIVRPVPDTKCGLACTSVFTARASSDPAGGDALAYNMRGALHLGDDPLSIGGTSNGGVFLLLTDYARQAFLSGLASPERPVFELFPRTDFHFSAGGNDDPASPSPRAVAGWGSLTALRAVDSASQVPEPHGMLLVLSAGVIAASVAQLRARRRA